MIRIGPVLERSLLGGAVLVRVGPGDMVRLDGSAAAIWAEVSASGPAGVGLDTLTARLAHDHDLAPAEIAADVGAAVERLRAFGAFEDAV